MRALLQRVSEASVSVDGVLHGRIGPGLLVLACAMRGDGPGNAAALARRIARLRVFADDAGRMNRALLDQPAPAALLVSQFTLAADTARGNRPGFTAAAPPDQGRALFDALVAELGGLSIATATGVFGAHMQLGLINDGPVTIWLEA